MPAPRHMLCVVLCAAYLPAATLPCPTPGLDRTRAPKASSAAASGHAHHARREATAGAGAHHAQHTSAHAGHHGHGHHRAVSAPPAPRADDASWKAPCSCGCAKRASSTPGSARLAPVLASGALPALPALRPALPAVQDVALPTAPFRSLDPVPI